MMTPSIPAIEFSVVQEVNETYYKTELLNELFYTTLNDFETYDEISNQSFSVYTRLFKTIKESVSSPMIATDNGDNTDDPQTQGLIILGLLFYGIIFYIIFKIVVFILRDIGAVIRNFINRLTSPFRALLQGIVTLIVFIINILFKIITGAIEVLGQGIVVLGQVIVFIIVSIVKLIQLGWRAIGTFLMLILQIFQLIFNTLFPAAIIQ